MPAVDWSVIDPLSSRNWVEAVLRVRRGFVDRVAKSKAKVDKAQAKLNRDKQALQEFDEALSPRMWRRRRQLLRTLGSHISTDDGQIAMRDDKNVLDHDPKREKELTAELEQRRARRLIIYTPKPSYKALGQMSPTFIRSLGHLGLTIGQMFYVSIKSTGEKDPTNIVRHRREGR